MSRTSLACVWHSGDALMTSREVFPERGQDRGPQATALSNCNAHRRGFTIVEMIAACVLMGMLFSITVPMLLIVARERRSAEQRQFALQHATNLLEVASARNWTQLVDGPLDLPKADADLESVLPGLDRTMEVKQIGGDVESRQIVATIRWKNHAGQVVSPIRISTWVHRSKDAP